MTLCTDCWNTENPFPPVPGKPTLKERAERAEAEVERLRGFNKRLAKKVKDSAVECGCPEGWAEDVRVLCAECEAAVGEGDDKLYDDSVRPISEVAQELCDSIPDKEHRKMPTDGSIMHGGEGDDE